MSLPGDIVDDVLTFFRYITYGRKPLPGNAASQQNETDMEIDQVA